MNIEYHYYITYILAKKGGFSPEDAATIAYTCQYTDDNNDKYTVEVEGEEPYNNYISQTLDILQPKNKLVRIYGCFHFYPGVYDADAASRGDGAMHLFNTTPKSGNAQTMFKEALDTNNLYRIGLATHCYSDTWSHQNFIGIKSGFGDKGTLSAKIIPSIGHADFKHNPDIPNLEWDDTRLVGKNSLVNNKERFMEASRTIFMAFAEHNHLDNVEDTWNELREELSAAIGEVSRDVKACLKGQEGRIEEYKKICPDMPEYDGMRWQCEALEPVAGKARILGDRIWQKMSNIKWQIGAKLFKAYWPKWGRVRTFRAKADFKNTPWFNFQEAVRAHQERVLSQLEVLYKQISAWEKW